MRLWEHPRWRALLHLRRHPVTRGWNSAADDPDFFLAPGGQRDARAELLATLRAVRGDARRPLGDASQPARCAFVARVRFLREQLGGEALPVPGDGCEAYASWRRNLGAVGLTLVFPEAFMNNPASMFGHTLLRVDTAETRDAGHGLLGWAVDFSGDTDGEGGPIYALKGLVGLYQGFYDVRPYYEKVKLYGDWENRDIWEYRLALSDEELERVLEHLWELQGIAFDYYYFDENCSYQLLALLEAALPGRELTRGFALYAIPADTVRRVVEQEDLVRGVRYRPSAETRLRHGLARLSRRERRMVRRLARGDLAPDDRTVAELPAPRRAAVLGLAHDALRYAFLAGDVAREASAGRSRELLLARSRVPVTGDPIPEPDAPRVRPDRGHASARVALAGGQRDRDSYLELRLRPAYHDLLDPVGGYQEGAAIRFLDTALRVFPESGRVRLHELVLLEMVSLVPFDPFFRHPSYALDTGLRTRLVEQDDGDLEPEPVWGSRAGLGLAVRPFGGALLYGLAEGAVDVGPGLRNALALGPAATAGLLLRTPSDRLALQLQGRIRVDVVGDPGTTFEVGAAPRLDLGRAGALVLRGSFHRAHGQRWLDASAQWRLYF